MSKSKTKFANDRYRPISRPFILYTAKMTLKAGTSVSENTPSERETDLQRLWTVEICTGTNQFIRRTLAVAEVRPQFRQTRFCTLLSWAPRTQDLPLGQHSLTWRSLSLRVSDWLAHRMQDVCLAFAFRRKYQPSASLLVHTRRWVTGRVKLIINIVF